MKPPAAAHSAFAEAAREQDAGFVTAAGQEGNREARLGRIGAVVTAELDALARGSGFSFGDLPENLSAEQFRRDIGGGGSPRHRHWRLKLKRVSVDVWRSQVLHRTTIKPCLPNFLSR